MILQIVLLFAGIVASLPAHAHVKWFSMMANCATTPITTLDIVSSPLFIGLTVAAFAAMFAVAAWASTPFTDRKGSFRDWASCA